MIYSVFKQLHITCVALSGFGFVLRGLWMLTDSSWCEQRWVRIVPHFVDTLLLGSALILATITSQYPFAQSWLTAKVLGLLLYIFCGTMALKRGKTKTSRAAFFAAALLVFSYIVSVAFARSPFGLFA